MTRMLPALLLLAACAPDLPPVDGATDLAMRAQDYPVLLPLDPLLAEGARAGRARAAEGPLAARGAALSRARIPSPGAEDVGARGQTLRERAARLRDRPA